MIILFLSVWAIVIALNEALFATQPFTLSNIIAALPQTMIFSLLLTVGVNFAFKRIHEALARGQSLDKEFIDGLAPEVSRVIDAAAQEVEHSRQPRVFPTQGEIAGVDDPSQEAEALARAQQEVREAEARAQEEAALEAMAMSPVSASTHVDQASVEPPQVEQAPVASPLPSTSQTLTSPSKASAKAARPAKKNLLNIEQLEKFLIPPMFRSSEKEAEPEEDLPDLMPADKKPRIRTVGFDFSKTATPAKKTGPSDNDRIFAERRARLEQRRRAAKAREEKIATLAAIARKEKEAEDKAERAARAKYAIRERQKALHPQEESAAAKAFSQSIAVPKPFSGAAVEQAPVQNDSAPELNVMPAQMETPLAMPEEAAMEMPVQAQENAQVDPAPAETQAATSPSTPLTASQQASVDPRTIVRQRMAQKAVRLQKMGKAKLEEQHTEPAMAIAPDLELAKNNKSATRLALEAEIEEELKMTLSSAHRNERARERSQMNIKMAQQQSLNEDLLEISRQKKAAGGVERTARVRESQIDTSALQRYQYRPPKKGAGLDTSSLRRVSLSSFNANENNTHTPYFTRVSSKGAALMARSTAASAAEIQKARQRLAQAEEIRQSTIRQAQELHGSLKNVALAGMPKDVSGSEKA